MIAKGYEVAFEAGLQTLVMTYVHMKTGWLSINVFKDLTKAYMQGGGTFTHIYYASLTFGTFDAGQLRELFRPMQSWCLLLV